VKELVAEARARLGNPPLVAHEACAAELDDEVEIALGDGEKLDAGGMPIEAILTPGHAAGHLAYLVDGSDVFTADVLFKGTVGGTMAPGASGIDDLRASVMKLMELPPDTTVHPGHREPTTIGEEWERNPFVRFWRGLDEEVGTPCTVGGVAGVVVVESPDYDGKGKLLVRLDGGEERIVGASRVELL